jgi:hypothetical protein
MAADVSAPPELLGLGRLHAESKAAAAGKPHSLCRHGRRRPTIHEFARLGQSDGKYFDTEDAESTEEMHGEAGVQA